MFKNIVVLFSLCWCFQLSAQVADTSAKVNFGSPLKIPLFLSGTYGELRSNHFHTGLDIKTKGKEDYRLYSVYDGYVSRIKTSPSGYGKVIYVTHTNGYTSVYAHLNRFRNDINDWVKEQQYAMQKYKVDLDSLPAGLFPVKKGDHIAYSGNSGSSLAPHLHFEIRETSTETPLNPLNFNFEVIDNLAPIIESLKVYSHKENGAPMAQLYECENLGSNMFQLDDVVLSFTDKISFAIKTHDKFDQIYNKNGVYSISCKVDGEEVYRFKMNNIQFNQSRFLNAHMDYGEYVSSKKKYHKLYVDKGNNLPIYEILKNDGIITIPVNTRKNISIEVSDRNGNKSTLNFVTQTPTEFPLMATLVEEDLPILYDYNSRHSIGDEWFEANFDPYSFYNDIELDYEVKDSLGKDNISPIITISEANTAVHKKFKLQFKNIYKQFEHKLHKAYIAYLGNGDISWAHITSNNDGVLSAECKRFGSFCVKLDTIAPRITSLIPKSGNVKDLKEFQVKITDWHSGIKSYNGFLNNEWILMEYDLKKRTLTYFFDNKLKAGKNTFRMELIDNTDNLQVFEQTIYR